MKILSGLALLLISIWGHSQDDTKSVIYNIDKLNSLNKLLIVIDGNKKGIDFDLKEIDPDNIAKIEVLKGDSARFYYGEAGLNGVIVLSTKTRPLPAKSIKPLWIVDGVKKDEEFLNNINPNDIESISVIKDSASTALYGDAGKNGVIIISLKKGNIIKSNQENRVDTRN